VLLETVAVHEVGHMMGLEQVEDFAALMFCAVGFCEDKVPVADDLAGRDARYDCTLAPVPHGR